MPFFRKKKTREELISAGFEAQSQLKYRKALALFSKAIHGGDTIDPLVAANICICKYHLGDGELRNIMGLVANYGDYLGPFTENLFVLAMLIAQKNGENESARKIAATIGNRNQEGWDLPTVPALLTQDYVAETKGPGGIPEALQALRRDSDCSAEHAGVLDSLIAKYEGRFDLKEEANKAGSNKSPEV
jgi:hypothetical protein